MSESGELDSGPSDKEGEKDKGSQVEDNEKKEKKSDEPSVVNTEVAGKKIVRTSGEEKVDSDSPPTKKLKQSNLPQTILRDRSKRPIEEVQLFTDPNEPIFDSDSELDKDSDDDSYWPDEVFLFEMEVPSTNRLVIPHELASNYFPPLFTRKPNEKQVETLEFTDSMNQEWYMPIQYYRDERGFMILSGWQKFSTQHDVQAMDAIRIFEPVPRLHTQHFLIEVVKKQGRAEVPAFREENFLFQIELERGDIEFRRVFLARDDVRNFPGVKMQRNSRERKKIMRFTDAKGKDWYMNIVRYSENKYMVMDGWSEFVKERGLEVGDVVVFFMHERPCHRKHYLIGIAKKEGGGNPGQPGGGDVAGPGGPSRPGGGSGLDPGGPSRQGGGSGPGGGGPSRQGGGSGPGGGGPSQLGGGNVPGPRGSSRLGGRNVSGPRGPSRLGGRNVPGPGGTSGPRRLRGGNVPGPRGPSRLGGGSGAGHGGSGGSSGSNKGKEIAGVD